MWYITLRTPQIEAPIRNAFKRGFISGSKIDAMPTAHQKHTEQIAYITE